MKRLQFMLTRVAQGLVALVLIATVNFMLVRAAPGDPVSVMAGEAGASDQQFVDQLRREFGLDQPLGTQLATYLGHVVRLDLGFSYRQQQPVAKLIADRLPATLLLTGSAFVLSLIFGVVLGALAARKPGSWLDSAITVVALVFYATPLYWLAMMAVLLFTVQMNWLPGFGYMTVGSGLSGLSLAWDIAQHLVLPSLTLALFFMAVYARMTRASMLEVAQMDFVKTARAKGVKPGRIQRAHILRNALLPVVTLAGIQAGSMIGGAVLTETVFAWPGIGRLMFDALLQRDYNLLLGCFLVTAAMAILFNLITDLVYTLVDPRIRL
ncbi:peptide/nickel transport system permease protein [Pseudacidovorax intermedius]|uniref:Peptide/nickel transport system permease protein n=2 Tax=Pseudacidovorax intermedius TaxID=433924 RepID=A0A370F8S2_9BURK|nr:ABC transporter permease [Pseudacidovorax intermedius]RDI19131.1 peptide/nickel transport system permease protein [Pseudacidovorax intermedius]